jgi:TonB family protein
MLVHVLALWYAMLLRDTFVEGDADATVLVAVVVESPRPEPPAPQPARPKLQEIQQPLLAPTIADIPIEQPETPVPEAVVVDIASGATADPGLTAGGDSGRSDGGGIVLLQRVLPIYPRAAARRGEQGVTGVLIHLAQNGRVDDVKLERSSGYPLLDKAALDAFRRWRFAPLAPGTAPRGRWLRTDQRFILYQFLYSRLEEGAADSVYSEHLKPKQGSADEETPGSQEALVRFIAQLRAGAISDPGGPARAGLADLRATLEAWGPVKSVLFTGIVGNSRWMTHGTRRDASRSPSRTVEVSWNMFELRHERMASVWLIATDREGEVWAARAGEAPWK